MRVREEGRTDIVDHDVLDGGDLTADLVEAVSRGVVGVVILLKRVRNGQGAKHRG